MKQETNMSLANMSLDNTSHPGTRDPKSWFRRATRCGSARLTCWWSAMACCRCQPRCWRHNADPAVRATWLDDMFLPPDAFDWALNVVMVRSGGQTILIDAGLGSDPDLHLPRAGQLIKRLEAAGIDLASVTDVVLTHMHMDHVGGLLVDGVKERLRPDLRIHVAAAEVKFWESPDFSHVSMPPGFPDALRATAKRFMKEYRSQLRLFEERVRGCAGRGRPSHRRPHPRAQRGPPGVRRRPADVRRRRRVRGRVRPPRVAQRLRTRPRGGGPRSGPSVAGAGGDRRDAGGHSPAVPVRRPCGGRRRRLSLGTGRSGTTDRLLVRPN